MNVFLSTSNLEGGPIPLIEAMMSNCIPVTSNVGFCPDIIKHGENGFLFDISNTNAKEISKLIIKAFNLTELNIRDTVLNYNWDSFSRNVLNQLN